MIKGGVYDSGKSMLIFELNSQTNALFFSVLLQKLPPELMDVQCQGNDTDNWES